ncbi:MFS transporter [Streptomyces sp. NPDC004579]|uniref:MFS transporter n=1 Tax=Streptomyces sp. NPDC004579 TaxID=3154667 RepID=UPI0033BE96EF
MTYGDVLRVPHTARLLAATLLGRLPSGMAPLAILLATEGSGAAVSAGLTALYLLANAAGGPLLGRLVDRHGQTVPLAAAAALSALALGAVAGGPHPLAWTAAAVTVAGAAKPPLDAVLRALLGTALMPTARHRRTALTLDAACQELIYVVGPLLVAALALAASTSWALWATAVLGAAGTALVVTAPPSRSVTAQRRTPDWMGPLRSSRLRLLYLAMLEVGVPIGALTPLSTASAAELGAPWLAGALPAALSIGAFAGGLIYGARSWPGTTGQHLFVLAAVSAAAWLPIALADHPSTALAAVVLPGLVMAPLLGTGFMAVGSLAPRGTATEAQALLVAALDVGCAAGTACAGLAPTTVLLPATAASAVLVLAAGHRRLNQAEGSASVPERGSTRHRAKRRSSRNPAT